ncbi:MAG: pteridine reductase [Cellvibrionaceae bacterium]|nr:pteridine reductase [Cellvibrionaceae bacterium]
MNNNEPVVLITGAAARIGAALVEYFHQRGYRVLIHYRHSAEAAQALARRCNEQRADSCALLQADLEDHQQVLQLAQDALAVWQRLDVLINNASRFFPTPLGAADERDWHSLMSSNLKAPFFLSQALAPELAQRQGCIINLVDIHADKPMAKHSIYNMAKAGNAMLTKTLALELAPEVRVNGIAPGAILWPAGEAPNPELLAKIPMAKAGGTEPICAAAYYLAKAASYSTGQILNIDGGRSLSM